MDETLILSALNRIENKQDSQAEAIAKIQGWISSNGFVREKTYEAAHAALVKDVDEFKQDVKDRLKIIVGRQWAMWAKIAGLAAAVTAFGKYILPAAGA